MLTRKEAYTRPVAADIAAEYWEAIDEITDAALEPRRVAEWMRARTAVSTAGAEEDEMQPQQVNAELLEDFSAYSGPRLRVLPSADGQRIEWYDPAGFIDLPMAPSRRHRNNMAGLLFGSNHESESKKSPLCPGDSRLQRTSLGWLTV